MAKNDIQLETYNNIWNVERFLKHVNGIRMEAISLTNASYFLAAGVVEIALIYFFPVVGRIPWIVLGAFPFVVSFILKKVEPDGRHPVIFMSKVLEHFLQEKTVERFYTVEGGSVEEEIHFDCLIPCRRYEEGDTS